MTNFDFNNGPDRFQVLDSFAQLVSGSDLYRFRLAQGYNPILKYPQLVRIADDGTFWLNRQVMDARYEIDTRMTDDMADTATPPTNTRTISYYIYQKNQGNSVQLNISTVYVAKDSVSNKFVRFNCTFELDTIEMPRILEDGDVGLHMEGIILLKTPAGVDCSPSLIRSSS